LHWFPNFHTDASSSSLCLRYLLYIVLLCTSLLFLLAHVCFQTILYTYPPLSDAIGDNCSQWNTVTRHIGVSRYLEDDSTDKTSDDEDNDDDECAEAEEISGEDDDDDDEERSLPTDPDEEVSTATRAKQMAERLKVIAQKVLRDLGRILAVGLLALAGITLPSAFSSVYFLLFIGVCTWWAYHLPISHLGFNAVFVMVGFFTAGHMVCLYLYQSLLAQALFPPHSLWARLFGLKDIIIPGNCSSPYRLNLNTEHEWPVYVNPGILLLLYITIATVLKTGCHGAPKEVSAIHKKIHKRKKKIISYFPCSPGADGVPTGQQTESPFFLLARVVMQQSYVCALIAMMVWSITYHSWLTFVLLLWACLIWMLRARRHAATLCSPFILLYGLALCCLQYVWAMELQSELPTTVGTMSLRQLGLDRAQYPCLRLGAMHFCVLIKTLFLLSYSAESAGNESVLKVFGSMVMSCHAKYWIYVCGGMFIMVSFAGKLVAYKIIYMLLFLVCLCLYQVYYSLWRRLLKLFWWLVVAYTMLVLIAIYTYQFEDFPQYWRNFTGFTEEQLAAIGLETFALTELFTSIVIPGFFLLACILQLHYFHKPFMRITNLEHVTPIQRVKTHEKASTDEVFEEEDMETPADEASEDEGTVDPLDTKELVPSKWGLVMDRLLDLSRRFSDILTKIQVFLWRLLELHILKIVAFFSVWVAVQEPSVMNLVLVVLWSLAMPYSRFRPMASCLSTVWVCVIIVCKMLYQLSVVSPLEYSSNCSMPLVNETKLLPEEKVNSSLYKEPVDPANWFGIRKDATVLGYSKNHLVVLMLLVFEATVYRHQAHHYRQLQRSPPTVPSLFPATIRVTLDKGLLPCFKYFLNYTFYKFGLEICFLMTVNVIGQRMNFLVIVHGCWLVAILVKRRRAAIAKVWPKYCLFLSIFMIYQYLLCVGIPPALCIDYPWRWNAPVPMNSALIKWLYLPDFYTVPNSKNLIADFVLLMCASQQWRVFDSEHTEEWMVFGGENTDDLEPMQGRLFNPAPNFINCRSYLDMAKVLVFRYFFWFVLSVLFVTGATRISVFGLGYLLACFYFLLFGTQLLVKPSRTRLALWDCLIMYNVAVIIAKNMLSILACVFVFEMQKDFCWVIQLFSLVCTVKGYYDPKSVSDKTCSLPVEEAGIIWDGICFLCLLLQRRVFLSFYFLHVTAATLTPTICMSSLTASIYLLFGLPLCLLPGSSISNILLPMYPLSLLCTLLHSGDYYLFESDSEDEEELQSEEQRPQKQTACQLAYQAWVSSVKKALRDRQKRQQHLRRIAAKEEEKDGQQRVDSKQDALSVSSRCSSFAAGHGEMVQRILDILRFLWAIVLAMVDGSSHWLNLLTKQYRDISSVLCTERYFIMHKIKQVFMGLLLHNCKVRVSLRNPYKVRACMEPGSSGILGASTPRPQFSSTANLLSPEPPTSSIELVPQAFKDEHRHSRTASELLGDRQFYIEELEQSRDFYNNQNRLLKLLFAMYNLLAANSELVCYFIIVLNNVVSASVISLVLPILVFLWAMLAVPRPTKRFWMTAIVYTEVMVVVKYLFQFGFFPWNSVYEMTLNEDKPFFPPRILGLEKTDNYIKYDLLQLLALFFHRSLLMRYGLWDHEGPLEEETPLSESCKDEGKSNEEDNPERTGGENEEQVEGRITSSSTLDNLEMPEEDGLEMVGSNYTSYMTTNKGCTVMVNETGLFSNHCRLMQTMLTRVSAFGHWLFFLCRIQKVYRPTQDFFRDILHAEYRAATDVYALMFLTDVIDFIVIIFGFWAFGKHSAAADIASSLSEDQVPEAFLVMLLIQFSTMIIDRALYLRKTVLGKLIFQVILVFGIHLWMFFILPAVTERKFNQNFVAQLWYFVKCIYFGLSAYQIRCGYPTRILGNFLTKKYNHLNLFLFQGFRLVPFLVELRAVMDWVWTDTTLSLSNWMCVEDIYANIFIIKCSRETEKKYPQPKGQKKKKIVKYGMGGLIIFFLICIIWFPLLFISLVRSVVGVVNHPIDVTVTVKLGGYEPLFTMSVQQQSIQPYTEDEYSALTKKFADSAVAMQFITLYSYDDIVTAMIEGSSGSVWRISPPSRQEVIKELLGSPVDLTLRLAWTFQRDLGKGGTVEHTFDKHSIDLEPGNPVRAELASLLVGNRTEPVLVPNMFPNYIRAPNGAEAKPVNQLFKGQREIERLHSKCFLDRNQEWWDIAIAGCAPSSCGVLPMIIFNDKVSPPSLGFLAGYGIMGLYVSVVLVIGKFVRGFFSEISHSIMFEELPCVDRILKLCTDIFLVRETGELELEEELYSKLIFLYRSPETMIKWTRDIQKV
uniref:Piezo type mechanosensitive ion channel component 1 (Er blood group) n=1 Tax=Cynoglossus semilaevis TaxID=244447 RepID=A0A3P8WJ68_CYNSE